MKIAILIGVGGLFTSVVMPLLICGWDTDAPEESMNNIKFCTAATLWLILIGILFYPTCS